MNTPSQVVGIPDVDFVNNTNQRTPCVLILDGSGSMDGEPIAALNQGLVQLQQDLQKDSVARERVRFLVIRLGDQDNVSIECDWTDAVDFEAPQIHAHGTTPLGGALNLALDKLEAEKLAMKQAGISYTRPLIYLITDGSPTDGSMWSSAASRCQSAIQAKRVQLFAIGVEGAEVNTLKQTGGTVMQLKGLNFKELFQFLSASVSSASQAAPGQNLQVTVPPSITIAT